MSGVNRHDNRACSTIQAVYDIQRQSIDWHYTCRSSDTGDVADRNTTKSAHCGDILPSNKALRFQITPDRKKKISLNSTD